MINLSIIINDGFSPILLKTRIEALNKLKLLIFFEDADAIYGNKSAFAPPHVAINPAFPLIGINHLASIRIVNSRSTQGRPVWL